MADLRDGYVDLPTGKVANVITCLEMTQRVGLRRERSDAGFELVRHAGPDLEWYRDLFRLVGGPYLWFSRLTLDDEALRRALDDSRVELYTASRDGRDVGMLELDFFEGDCELRFFGAAQEAIGTGLGRWMMNRAIERAWSRPIRRFHLRTCTLDHPAALAFYIRSGFTAYKRMIEISDDPRLVGLLPRETAPDIPIV